MLKLKSPTRRGLADSKRLLVLFMVTPANRYLRDRLCIVRVLRIQYKTEPKPKVVKVTYWLARRLPRNSRACITIGVSYISMEPMNPALPQLFNPTQVVFGPSLSIKTPRVCDQSLKR